MAGFAAVEQLASAQRSTLVACPKRLRPRRLAGQPCRRSTQAPCALFAGGGSLYTPDTLKLVSEVATTLSVAAGAYWVSRELLLEQDRLNAASKTSACPRCDGTGFVPCMCTRWSDNDVGCSSCSQTGRMRCHSCGGGGTAVPLPVAVSKPPR